MGGTVTPGRSRTGHVRCKDGDHTLELHERDLIAERLLKASRKHSFNPDTDVDWDLPLDPDRFFISPTLVSLYETPLWDGLTHRQRVELSKRELCSLLSFGITSELALMAGLVNHASGGDYATAHWAYALTEVEDECRHSRMFARVIGICGLKPAPVLRWQRYAPKLMAVADDPMTLFAGALVIEEYTDAMQRIVMGDEGLQPLARQVSRIHVIEETRHIKYAHEELKRQVVARSALRRRISAYALARGMRMMLGAAVRSSCYTAVGLDPRAARAAVRASLHRRQTEQWLMAKCMRFLEEIGFLDGPARGAWDRAGLLADRRW